MSPRKRKAHSTPQLVATFDAVDAVITRVKPKLADLGSTTSRASLLDDLQHLAILGETFSGQRSRTDITTDLTDSLDREGIHLWNTSGLISQGLEGDEEEHALFAALRLAAFRLIEAGIEQDPDDEVLINMLQLASKTGAALSACGRGDAAMSVLGCAAKFEEQLRKSDDRSNDASERAKARAVIDYLSSRMLAAWKDGNDAIAEFMLEKITEGDNHRLNLISPADRELLASRILGVGKGVLKISSRVSADGSVVQADAKRAQDAVKWIQRAFALIEKMEDPDSAGLVDLKRSILRSLARAYYISSSIDSENLSRAEATLQELIASIENAPHNTEANPEHQQLRWMRVAVLKKRNAPEASILAALRSIVEHIDFTESEITDILQELRTFQHHALISEVLSLSLKTALARHPAVGTDIVDRLLLALLSHCSRDSDTAKARQDIEAACSCIIESEYELSKTPAMACLTILWKFGDRLYQSKTWSQAADWFLLGTHRAFASISEITSPKCLRKAALCYLEQREYARAVHTIQRCPKGKASTLYLTFLSALYQGLEDEAIAAIVDMANAADFDRKMLLLATQLAHESDSKAVLLSALEALLRTVHSHGPMDSDSEAILLVRCILRLVIRLRKECQLEVERLSLSLALIKHFKTAVGLAKNAIAGRKGPVLAKDISWLWRTAYNVAVQSCSEGQLNESQIADLFDFACELADTYASIEITNADTNVNLCVVRAAFASVSARVFALRNSSAADGEKREVLDNIHRVKIFIKGKSIPDPEMAEILEMLRTCQLFEMEIYCSQRAWDKVLEVVMATDAAASSLPMFEAIADLVWSEQDCPVTVIYAVLEAILHCCLDRGIISVEKFSRWLRAICTILLSRNSQADRKKVITYAEQALTVMEDPDSSGESYPMDERHWLLSTAYNTGVECLASSQLNEARRWFEVSTCICRFVPDGARQSERISETYQKLLAQYAPEQSQERP